MITLRDVYATDMLVIGQRFMGIGRYTGNCSLQILEGKLLQYSGNRNTVHKLSDLHPETMAEFVLVN